MKQKDKNNTWKIFALIRTEHDVIVIVCCSQGYSATEATGNSYKI